MTTVQLLTLVVLCVHLTGLGYAVHAVLCPRSSQAAIGWSVSLITFPWIALPLYWVFGRNRLPSCVRSRRGGAGVIEKQARQAIAAMLPFRSEPEGSAGTLCQTAERLTRIPCTTGNAVDLLVDGGDAFSVMLEAISRAERYVLVQFFIVEGGKLSDAFAEVLKAKAREGVKVCFLFDELGSRKLSRGYLRSLQGVGIHVSSYRAVMGPGHRLQLNFRNHRKVTVVDGAVAFVGGLNLGDEYLGKHGQYQAWRDTHLRVRGPAVLGLQLGYFEDWRWATGEVLELDWTGPAEPVGTQRVSVVPTGPADRLETCELFVLHAIQSATTRLWIASPYFVPGPAVCAALQLAVVRGVDVRILLPQNPDHRVVYLASFSYYQEMELAGVGIYRYQPGFIHQKVMLIDDHLASVGTVNLDNRSFHLNFEITLLVVDELFAARVEKMLETDFARSRRASLADFMKRGVFFRLSVRLARLFSPIL